jgi:hypothetical protein
MYEFREGDEVLIYHIIDLWKMDLPLLTNIITNSTIRMMSAANKTMTILRNLRFKTCS